MKKELHKWQYGIECGRYYPQHGRYFFRIYCVWLTFIPMAGDVLHKRNYRGFIWEVKSPTPTVSRTFVIPKWLHWLLPYRVYDLPIKWTLK